MENSPLDLLIPEKWRQAFELIELKEKGEGEKGEMNMLLREKKEMVPASLRQKAHVLNGFMEPLEIIDFPFRGKLMYITFLRRRWKEPGEGGANVSHFNTYEFHRPGMKTTDEFGDFLKELDRKEFDELCRVWPALRNLWEETL